MLLLTLICLPLLAAPDSQASEADEQAPLSEVTRIYSEELHTFSSGSAFLAAVMDADDDGHEEVLVGAPSTSGAGRAELLSGRTGETLFTWEGSFDGGRLGAAVAGLGDTDGDGRGELALGAPGALSGRGMVGLVHGADRERIRWIQGAEDQRSFGYALASGRDATADGRHDLVVGAPASDGHGSVTLIDGLTGEIIWTARPEKEEGLFGIDVALVPDLDGDARADVLVGQRGAGAVVLSAAKGEHLFHLGEGALGTQIGGSVTVLERADASPLLLLAATGVVGGDENEELPDPAIFVYDASTRALAEDTSFALPYAGRHDLNLGLRLRSLGDLDGDGHDDLAICQPNGYPSMGPTGKLEVRSGASDAMLFSTWWSPAGFEFSAWHCGSDACAVRAEEGYSIAVTCPSAGGVSALRQGEKPERVWVRLDRKRP